MCISKTFQNGVLVGWGESLSNKIQQIISFYLTDDRAGSLSSFCRGFVFWWHLPRNFLPLWRGWGWAQRPRLACRFRLLNTEIITQINRCAAWRRRSCREEETLQREETEATTRRETEPSRAQLRCRKLRWSRLTELLGEMEKKDGARAIPSAWSVPTSSPPSSDAADRSAGLDPTLLTRPGSVKLHQFGCLDVSPVRQFVFVFVCFFALGIFVPGWVKNND